MFVRRYAFMHTYAYIGVYAYKSEFMFRKVLPPPALVYNTVSMLKISTGAHRVN